MLCYTRDLGENRTKTMPFQRLHSSAGNREKVSGWERLGTKRRWENWEGEERGGRGAGGLQLRDEGRSNI